jgi:hypothetical protein
MRSRLMLSMALGASLVLGLIASPAAQAGTAAKSNTGRAVHGLKAVASVKPHSIASFKKFSTPTAKYVSKTCAIDLSAIPDFTVVNSVTGCGVTVSFSIPMEKRSVPNSWATWGSPPDTEGNTPNILYTAGGTSVTLTYSSKGRRVGVEVEPNQFQVESFTAIFRKGNGNTVGTINRADVDGNAGAKLLAGATGAEAKQYVKSLVITDNSGDDFSIAQIRVS